jgi:hypothetical protein
VRPCHKSADIPLTIKATQLASKVDTIIIMSGDSDFIELVRHLKGEGVRVEIAAVPETTSRLLLEDADYFHTLDKDDCYYLEARKPQRQARPKRTRQPRKQDSAPANKTGQDGQSQKSRAAQGQKPGAAQGQKPGAAKGPAEQASQGTAAKAPEKKTQAKRRPRRQTKAKAPADDNAGNR